MRVEILIPQLGLAEDVTIVEWLKADGETVARGETIAVIATEKTNADLQAPASGTLEIALRAGPDPVPGDAVLGYVTEER